MLMKHLEQHVGPRKTCVSPHLESIEIPFSLPMMRTPNLLCEDEAFGP